MHIPWLLRCLGPLHPSTLRSDISFPGRLFWTIWVKATPRHLFLHTSYSTKHHSLYWLYSAYKKLKWSSLHIYIFIHFPISSNIKIYGQRRVTSARWLKSVIPDFGASYGESNLVYISTDMMPLQGFQTWGWYWNIPLGHQNRKIASGGKKEWFYFGCINFSQDGTKESPWAYSFSSGKRRSQHGHSASPTSWDVSWEAHLDIASWRSLGESARDK